MRLIYCCASHCVCVLLHYTLKRLLITGAQKYYVWWSPRICSQKHIVLTVYACAFNTHCSSRRKKYPLINHWTFTYFCSYYKLKGKSLCGATLYYVIASVNGPLFRRSHTHPSNLKSLEWWFFATQFSLLAWFWSASRTIAIWILGNTQKKNRHDGSQP